MKGIQPKSSCPKCQGAFTRHEKKGYICATCLTVPDRYIITIWHNGERIRRATTLEGKTLVTYADAFALYRQAEAEKDSFKFDPKKWKSKAKLEYSFSYLIDKWYKEKEVQMKKGELAPSYVPKLFTYIKHYYLPFFGNMDVREILSLKDFSRQLPDRISPKYKKNRVFV